MSENAVGLHYITVVNFRRFSRKSREMGDLYENNLCKFGDFKLKAYLCTQHM